VQSPPTPKECTMKLIHLGGTLAALLVAACASNQPNPRHAAAEAAEEKQEAQGEAREAHKDADKARHEEKEATRAEHEAQQNARFAGQRQAQAEAQASGQPTAMATTPPHPGSPEMQGSVSFGSNSAALSAEAKAKLDEVAASARTNPQGRKVVVLGYSDDSGVETSNAQLSMRRAEEVSNYLESKGIARERITTKAMGTQNPASAEKSPHGQALNRRVEVVVDSARK
jgi:outer membrane protein OmpA-like peptidoglycan-associated protein